MDIWDIIGREVGESFDSSDEEPPDVVELVTYGQIISALSNSFLLKKCYKPPPTVAQALVDLNRILNSQKVRGWTLRRKAAFAMGSEFE